MERESGKALSARACTLTPKSRGAIAVIRVWGPDAIQVVNAVFRPHGDRQLGRIGSGRIRLGRVGEEPGDEVVACVVSRCPPEVELHCHGGPGAVAMVVQTLVAAGAESRRPVAWVRHQARSLVAAEAMVDLARAPTVRTAEILLDQWHGALEREVHELTMQSGRDLVRHGLERLLERERIGTRLISGWKVALAGRPNVGKSRLLNALAGYTRAIVDPMPGTTRDLVTIRTSINGWPVELADTAGLRASADDIEADGIRRARAYQAEADLRVLVLNRSEPLSKEDHDLLNAHHAGLIVANKADLPAAWETGGLVDSTVSAASGEGIEPLVDLISKQLVPDPPAPGAGVPFRPRHRRWLETISC